MSITPQMKKKMRNICAIYQIHSQCFKKNLNYDTIHVLKQVDNKELRDKQIEILEYSKILSWSENIKYKPIEIKNPSQEQLQDIYNNKTYLETIEYENLDSKIQIDKFER